MPHEQNNPIPAAGADEARREREKTVSEEKSGTQERRAQPEAEADTKHEAVDRASNAAMAHRPAG